MKLDRLILKKIITVATRCQILRLKCTKFDFGWGSAPAGGAYSAEGVRIEAPIVTELKFSVTVQDVAVVSSRMCPKITKDVAKK